MAAAKRAGVPYILASPGKGIKWVSLMPRPPNALKTAKFRDLREIETARWALFRGPEGTDIILLSFAHPRGKKLPYEATIHGYVFCNGSGSPIPKKKVKKVLRKKHGVRVNLIPLESRTLLAAVRRELSIVAMMRHTGASKTERCSFLRLVFDGNDKDGYTPKPTFHTPATPILPSHASICAQGHPFHYIGNSFVGMFPDLGRRVNEERMFVASDVTGMFIVTKMGHGDMVQTFGLWWVSTEAKYSTLVAVHNADGNFPPAEPELVDGIPDVAGTADGDHPYCNPALRNIVEALQSQSTIRMRVIGYTTKDPDGLPSCGTVIVTAVQRGLSVSVDETMAFEIVRHHGGLANGEPTALYTLSPVADPTPKEDEPRSPALYYAGVFDRLAWTLRVGIGHGRRLIDNQLQDVALYERLPSNAMAQIEVFRWACRPARIVLLEGYSMPQSRFVYLMAHCPSRRGELVSVLVVVDVVTGYAFGLNVYGQAIPESIVSTFEEPAIDISQVKYPQACTLPDMKNDEVLAATWVPDCDYRRCTLSKTTDQRRAADAIKRARKLHGHMIMTRSDSVAIARDDLPNPRGLLDPDDPALNTRTISDLRDKNTATMERDKEDLCSSSSLSENGSATTSSPSTSRPSSPHRVTNLVHMLPALSEDQSTVAGRRRHNSMSAALSSLQQARNSAWESHVLSSHEDHPASRRRSQDSPLSIGAPRRTPRHAQMPRTVEVPLYNIPTQVPEVMRPVAIFTNASPTGQIDNVDRNGRPERIIVVCPLVIIVITPMCGGPNEGDRADSAATTIDVEDLFGEGASIMSARPYQDMTTPSRELGVIHVTLAMMSDTRDDTHASAAVFL